MNERVKKLKDRLQIDKYPLCIEKYRIAVNTLALTQGEPQILRRAKIIANVLDNITIFIEDDELFIGNGASKPMGLEIDYEYGTWSQDEITALKQEGYSITQEDEAELWTLNQNFKDKTLVSNMGEVLYANERIMPFMKSGVILPPWKNKEEGSGGGYAQSGMGLGPGFLLGCIDFSKVLNGGLNEIIEEAEQELEILRYTNADSIKKENYLKSVILANQAVIRFAQRYAALAAKMAEEELDPIRKRELNLMSETCRWVPANKVRTFYEAMQFFWFVFLMLNPSPTAAAGRFDQYMYPFYKKDKAEGRITDDEVLELLECLRIKDMTLNRTSGKANRKKNAGMAKWHNWTIGGVTPQGEDATNELTYLLLEAAKETLIPHHTITLRVHGKTPESLMIKALEVVKTGLGMPAFVSDKSYTEFFVKNGMLIEEARDYVMTGCLDGNIPAKSRTVAVGMFIVPLVFDIFMHNGMDPNTGLQVGIKTGEMESFATFEAFAQGFKEQLRYLMGLAAEKDNVEMIISRDLFPDPFRSSLMINGVKEGKDLLDRMMPFENGAVMLPIGIINIADSLAAIKRLIFDEKKVSMQQMKAALVANWEGFDDIHKLCLSTPKYGNGDDYVDSIAQDIYKFWADQTASFETAFGGKHIPTAISITSHQPGGALTGATPDGRYSREILADGSMSPMQGRDTHGPTGVIKSAIKIDQIPYQATLLNMKFHQSALETMDDLKKLATLIHTYFDYGGKHVQFNIVNKETLINAQTQPENYKNLVVRVAGYSAYFLQLGKEMQDEIIARTEHEVM